MTAQQDGEDKDTIEISEEWWNKLNAMPFVSRKFAFHLCPLSSSFFFFTQRIRAQRSTCWRKRQRRYLKTASVSSETSTHRLWSSTSCAGKMQSRKRRSTRRRLSNLISSRTWDMYLLVAVPTKSATLKKFRKSKAKVKELRACRVLTSECTSQSHQGAQRPRPL